MMRSLCFMLAGACMFTGCTNGERMICADDKEMGNQRFSAPMAVAESSASMPAPASSAKRTANAEMSMSLARQDGNSMGVDTIMTPAGRKMVFTADYFIWVANVIEAQNRTKSLAEELGGYVQRIEDGGMTIRVPLDKSNEALAAIAGIGEIRSRSINGEDVTESMVDYQITLDNLLILQQRLQKLAQQADNVEALLKVERELGRVTSEIERLKGQLKLLNNRVDFVTIQLFFNVRQPVTIQERSVPFKWAAMLGSQILYNPPVNGRDKLAFDVKLPSKFAVTAYVDGETFAASADGATIKLSRLKSVKNADLSFWTKIITRALSDGGFTLEDACEFTTTEGLKGCIITGFISHLSRTYGYRVLFVEYDKEVYLYEFWADEEVFSELEFDVTTSYDSLNLSFWR